jgi:hypothetical protein
LTELIRIERPPGITVNMKALHDGIRKRLNVDAIVLFIAMMLVACQSSASPAGTRTASPSPSRAAVTHQPGNPQDNLAAEGIATRASDLTGNWTTLRGGIVATADLGQPSTCLTPPAKFAAAVADAFHEFSLDLDSQGLESGHLVSDAIFDNTAQDAAAELTVVDSEAYYPCLRRSLVERMSSSVHLVDAISRERLTKALPLSGDAFELTAKYTAGNNRPDTLTLTDIHMVSGRILAHLQFFLCSCKPHDLVAWSHLQDQAILAIADRMVRANNADNDRRSAIKP